MTTNPQTLSFKHQCIKYLVKLLMQVIWLSCRITVINQTRAIHIFQGNKPFIPCYWHQHHLMGLWFALQLKAEYQHNIGALVSPSRDGEIPAQIIERWGIRSIRGSSSKTGAQALRDLCKSIIDDQTSPIITPDGPRGPIFEAKLGAIMLAQYSGAAIIPISTASQRCWQLRSWDQFQIPMPFSRVVINIGEPVMLTKDLSINDLEPEQTHLTTILNTLKTEAEAQFNT